MQTLKNGGVLYGKARKKQVQMETWGTVHRVPWDPDIPPLKTYPEGDVPEHTGKSVPGLSAVSFLETKDKRQGIRIH